MGFGEQFVKQVSENLESDVALMNIYGMFGNEIKYYIVGYVGTEQYLCIWLSDCSWGVCAVVTCLVEEEEPDIFTLGELCCYICEKCY